MRQSSHRTEGKTSMKLMRGQVGIGTLIVFIAMVLVATIAAAVFINTSGNLQSQSEKTGQESSSQTTDRIQITSIIAEEHVSSDGSEVFNVSISKAAGASEINLSKMSIRVITEDQIVQTISRQRSNSDGHEFAVHPLTDEDGSVSSSNVLNEDDWATLVFDIGSDTLNVGGSNVDTSDIDAQIEGQLVTVVAMTGSGGESRESFRVPNTLENEVTNSITKIDASGCTESGCGYLNEGGEAVEVTVTFSNVEGDSVYVVVEDASGDDIAKIQILSSGGSAILDLQESAIDDEEDIVVDMYETSSENNLLDDATCQEGTTCNP
jgi:flagellin FlaB